jgi:hypothetical protein
MKGYETLKFASIACEYSVDALELRDKLIDYQKQYSKDFISYEDIEALAFNLARKKFLK